MLDVTTDAAPDTNNSTGATPPAADAQCRCCHGGMYPWLDMPLDPMRRVTTSYERTERCTACGMWSVVPLPPRDAIAACYDMPDYYTHGAERPDVSPGLFDRVVSKLAWWRDMDRTMTPEEMSRRLPPGAAICDLGCGHAEHLVAFRQLGFSVVGVDPDPVARDTAARAGVNVLDGTADEPPAALAGRTFDFVIMTHALKHTRDPARALETCRDLLKPGGMLYCEIPNCAATHFRELSVYSTMFDAPRHLHFFEPRALRQMVVNAGLVPEEELYWGYTRLFSPEWRGWEASIAGHLRRHDPQRRPVIHDRLRTLTLLARTTFAAPERKYDSVGIFARRPS